MFLIYFKLYQKYLFIIISFHSLFFLGYIFLFSVIDAEENTCEHKSLIYAMSMAPNQRLYIEMQITSISTKK